MLSCDWKQKGLCGSCLIRITSSRYFLTRFSYEISWWDFMFSCRHEMSLYNLSRFAAYFSYEIVWFLGRLEMSLWASVFFAEPFSYEMSWWDGVEVCKCECVGDRRVCLEVWLGFFRPPSYLARCDCEWNLHTFLAIVFYLASSFNGNLNQWDVAKVSDMSYSKSIRIVESDLTWRELMRFQSGALGFVVVWCKDGSEVLWCWRLRVLPRPIVTTYAVCDWQWYSYEILWWYFMLFLPLVWDFQFQIIGGFGRGIWKMMQRHA